MTSASYQSGERKRPGRREQDDNFQCNLSFFRPPPERKSKDANNVKRVRAKRTTTKTDDKQNGQVEDKDDVIEEQQVSDMCLVQTSDDANVV